LPLPAYGVLSEIAKDQIYWFGQRGFLFTSPWVVTPNTVRHPGVVLLSASGRPFEITFDGRSLTCDAVAIAPHTVRGLRAVDVGLISVNVEVHHACYGIFRDIPAPGVQLLDRAAFRACDAPLQRAYEGGLTRAEADRLFEALVASAVAQLPKGRSHDLRADRLRAFLREHPTCSLADVARELGVSYARASRLFSRAVGMPLRAYQHWLKCMKAAEQFGVDTPWTQVAQEAGFADSSHFAHTWQRSFGHPPSYARDSRHVRIVA
jgi:AraC-like DNA-binding protein